MTSRWFRRQRSCSEDALTAPSLVAQARAFYAEHRSEVIQRMRHPNPPGHNPAARIVLICESDSDLRREAFAAQQAAASARPTTPYVDDALRIYDLGRT